MRLFLVLIISFLLMSCSSDTRRSSSANALCTSSTLNLSSFKPGNAKTVSLPSNNPNKSDKDLITAKDGIYVLSGATVHVHDKSRPIPDKFRTGGPEFLQFAITYRAGSQDKENNISNFNGDISCLSGLMPGYAGKLTYFTNLPTIIEVKDLGSNFVPKTLSTIEFGYKTDRTMKFISNPIADKGSIDKIEKINTSDNETITNIYRTSPTSEVYQLQSRVTQGDIILTVINSYTRCVDPNEEPPTEEAKKKKSERTQEESDKLEEDYQLCLSRTVNLNSKP